MNILILCLAALLGQDLFVVNADLRGVQVPDQTSVLHVAEAGSSPPAIPGIFSWKHSFWSRGQFSLPTTA